MPKDVEIKEIALNPRFLMNEVFKSLENQGFPVRWMTEDEINEEKVIMVINL